LSAERPTSSTSGAARDKAPPHASVLFVCMGNICRSPTAEGVFRALVEREWPQGRLVIDSAGTHDYHVGRAAHPVSVAAAAARGFDLSTLRARQVEPGDFGRFDLVLAMDRSNLALLKSLDGASTARHLGLFMGFSERYPGQDVPDPYGGAPAGFERVLDMVEDASLGLIRHLRAVGG
jgi:protein-tyrosine phosphatase